MGTSSVATIPQYPMARAAGCPFDPPPALRVPAPISPVRLWDGTTPWLVTRHADVRALLGDQRVSADSRREGYPHAGAGGRARRTRGSTFISMDDPEHARLRKMVTRTFAIRRVEALLGVPYADHDFFQSRTRVLVVRDQAVDRVIAAQDGLVQYLGGVIAHKLAEPAEDLLSRLAAEHIATGELSPRERALMAMLLLLAGHETTANMIGLGTLALLEHPGQLAAVRDTDDPAVIATVTETRFPTRTGSQLIAMRERTSPSASAFTVPRPASRAHRAPSRLWNALPAHPRTALGGGTGRDRLPARIQCRRGLRASRHVVNGVSMRVIVDRTRCMASGQCVLSADAMFDQREEDGTVVLLDPGPPAELDDDVRRAAMLCPAQAITVIDS
jgi:ferredoxin